MDVLDLIEELNKILRTKKQDISDVILTGGIENYSNYQNLVGQLKSLDFIEQEVKDFLQKRKMHDSK
jgi:DUF1009 family protein